MTEPQLPPPSSYGSIPPIPPAPSGPAAPGAATGSSLQYQTPPGAYAAPVGGYAAPDGPYRPPQSAPSRPAALGVVAFVLSIIAGIIAPIVGGTAGYQIGFRLPTVMDHLDPSASDLSFLSPVRDQVLMGEIGFWLGTLTGIAALVLGIMAIVQRRGRAWGITAIVLAAVGPVLFFIVLSITLGIGAGAGTVSYYGA